MPSGQKPKDLTYIPSSNILAKGRSNFIKALKQTGKSLLIPEIGISSFRKKDNALLSVLRASPEYLFPEGVSELNKNKRNSQIAFTVI